MTSSTSYRTIGQLIGDYDVLLFDMFGVLMDGSGPLPNAPELIQHLNEIRKPYLIVSNGSRFTRSESAQQYASKRLEIPETNIITSGTLVEEWVQNLNRVGSNAIVIGPPSSVRLCEQAGLKPVDLWSFDPFSVFVLADQHEITIPILDKCLSRLMQQFREGNDVLLLLPNPDIVFPAGGGDMAFTSGAFAKILEEALSLFLPPEQASFVRLGQPFPPIFDAAKARYPGARMLMIGDQLSTDILGANLAGIDSALIGHGLTRLDYEGTNSSSIVPTYMLNNLRY